MPERPGQAGRAGRQRIESAQLDPRPTGATSARNLGLLSSRCHNATHHGCTLTRHGDGSVTWHSPLHRRYHRPGPRSPPPKVDPHDPLPPPLRQRQHRPRADDSDTPLLNHPRPPTPAKPPPVRSWHDDPPF